MGDGDDDIAAIGGDSDMGSICIIGGGGPTGWEFFTHFDAYDKASIKGTEDFFNDTQRWMNEKGLGVDMGHWNQDIRRRDGLGLRRRSTTRCTSSFPSPLLRRTSTRSASDQSQASLRKLLPDAYADQDRPVGGSPRSATRPSRTRIPDGLAFIPGFSNK